MNRCDRVIEYMKSHKKGLTVKQCEEEIGTTELRKTICELEDKGYKFAKVWEEGTNRYGDPVRYKRYSLIGNESK